MTNEKKNLLLTKKEMEIIEERFSVELDWGLEIYCKEDLIVFDSIIKKMKKELSL